MLARENVAASFTPGTHAATFGGNPLVTTVAMATLTTILEQDLVSRAAEMGARLGEALRTLQARHAAITAVRGKGLLLGMELDRDVGSVLNTCLEEGLLLSKAGERVIRFAPPLIVTEAEITRAAGILDKALGEVTG